MPITVIRDPRVAQQWTARVKESGRKIAFVPTMGFLHEGHLTLMREGKAQADVVVASIFVNPTQFGPKEDLGRYPRDLEGDLRKCESSGVEMVFAPEPAGIYPEGAQTWVEVTEVSRGLCGEKRPGHFRGVATVVAKLFNIIRPDVALFGEKDYQQLQVLRTMARDLHFGIEVVGVPTIREPDGLAMSSRNVFLSAEERARALAISRGLRLAQQMVKNGVHDVRELVTAIRTELERAQIREDYVEVVDAQTLRPLARLDPARPTRALVAGFLGQTRLIDNLGL